jgi:ATP-dependent Clp protease ATP-binding subunit ClpC
MGVDCWQEEAIMFERYTEKARRIVFFARYEAARYGSPYIEPAHLLLGILRESFPVIQLVSATGKVTIQQAIGDLCADTGQQLATSVDLPLSNSSKRALVLGAEEAEAMDHKHIGPEHLLLGVLRMPGLEAGVLARFGIALEAAREVFRASPGDPAQASQATDSRTSITRLLVERVPPDRLQAALRILSALSSEYFTASGVSAEGPFSYSFGEVPPAA